MTSNRPQRQIAPFLISLVVGAGAGVPFFNGRIPYGDDTGHHLYRLLQLDELLNHGILYSRWAPQLMTGYGLPLFNYYAPASYYLPAFIHRIGVTIPDAFLAAIVLTLIASSSGAYLLGSHFAGSTAGLVAAAGYTFTPIVYLTSIQRGALPELIAQAMLPYLFWLLSLWVNGQNQWSRPTFTILLALLICTHNITAMLALPALVISALLLADWQRSRPDTRRNSEIIAMKVLSTLVPIALALGLSAFFWLPALAEVGYINTGKLYMPAIFDYSLNFVTLADSLSAPFNYDAQLINRHIPISLNSIVALLAAGGIFSALLRRHQNQRARAIYLFSALGLIYHLMALSISSPIWRAIAPLKILQFPWRFLPFSSLFYIMPASYGVDVMVKAIRHLRNMPQFAVALLISTIILFTTPWLMPSRWGYLDKSQFQSTADSIAFELHSGVMGTTATGEYAPNTMLQAPPVRDVTAAKIQQEALPSHVRLKNANFGPVEYQIDLTSAAPFSMALNTLYFPGWTARIDGVIQPIVPSTPHGLITVPMPAGSHRLTVTFENTPIRRIANVVSLASLLLFIPISKLSRNDPKAAYVPSHTSAISDRIPLLALLGTLLAQILLVKPILATYSQRDHIPMNPTMVNFSNEVALYGTELPSTIEAGSLLPVELYWQPNANMDVDYSSSIMVRGADGNLVGQIDSQHLGGKPTSSWWLGGYVIDSQLVDLRTGTPPGKYTLELVVYQQNAGRLDILNSDGLPTGQSINIAEFEVVRPLLPLPLTPAEIDAARPLTPDVTLLESQLDREQVEVGQRVFLKLSWYARARTSSDLEIRLSLISSEGQLISVGSFPLVGTYPTSKWQKGDHWTGRHSLLIPPEIAPGSYQLIGATASYPHLVLGSLTISVPQREFSLPPLLQPIDTAFDNLISLTGLASQVYNQNCSQLEVDLIWKGLANGTGEYKSFVHLLDSQGRYLAGSDQVPGRWSRPTTGWIAGEYITDPHTLLIPESAMPPFMLSIGLYDAQSMNRLFTSDGLDSVTVSVEGCP